jgi:hypothetical protein
MAITYVGGTSASITPSLSTTTNVSLTGLTGGIASAPATDDLVLVLYAVGSAVDVDIGVVTSGYTEDLELYQGGTTYNANLSVSRKFMGGTPDTDVEVSATGGGSNGGVVIVQVWRGVDAATPLDVTPTTNGSSAANLRPNPPAITPVTTGAVIVAMGMQGGSPSQPALTQAGSELSNFVSLVNAASRAAAFGAGWVNWTSGAFDPVGFTGGTTSGVRTEIGVTMALRPGSGEVEADLDETLAAATLSSAVSVLVLGNLAETLAAASLSSVGSVSGGIAGIVGETPLLLADATLESAVYLDVRGNLDVALDAAALVAGVAAGSTGPFAIRPTLVFT